MTTEATLETKKKKGAFWVKIAEHNLLSMLVEMGNPEEAIIKWQKRRVLKTIALFIAGIIFAFVFSKWMIIGLGFIVSLLIWRFEYSRVVKMYKNFLFEKQLVFNKFARMMIPLLMQKGATLYVVLNKMRKRIADGHVKDSLERFLISMTDNPNSDEPFVQFAMDASGTDHSILFMTTLFDYKQNSNDTSLLEELGQMASQELFQGVDEIIAFKLRKFALFPTKLTMASFLIIIGYGTAMIVNTIKSIHL